MIGRRQGLIEILIKPLVFLGLMVQIGLKSLDQFFCRYFVAALSGSYTMSHLNSHYITSPYYTTLKFD